MKKVGSKYPGVFERASEVRTHKGKPDVCFYIAYKHVGKLTWEKVGWASEGYSAPLALQVRGERIRTMRHSEELPKQKKKYPLFKELAEYYLKWGKDNKKSYKSDKHRYENHLQRFDQKRLNEITSFDLEKLKSDLQKQDYAAATVRQCLILVQAMFNRANIIRTTEKLQNVWPIFDHPNPMEEVKFPTVQNRRERFLSFDEADTLLIALKKRHVNAHDMTLLALNTGMRCGEICNLTWRDIDFTHGLINILDTKNEESRSAHMTEAIKEMLVNRRTDNLDEYIFLDPFGHKYTEAPKAYREIANTLFNQGVKDPRRRVTFHSLRHTFASWLALRGESQLTIKDLLGHKGFAMTERYTHLSDGKKRSAAVGLSKMFSKRRKQA